MPSLRQWHPLAAYSAAVRNADGLVYQCRPYDTAAVARRKRRTARKPGRPSALSGKRVSTAERPPNTPTTFYRETSAGPDEGNLLPVRDVQSDKE